MQHKTRIATTILSAALLATGAVTALAQAPATTGDPATGAPPPTEQSTAVSDSELTLFAEAATEVAKVQREVQTRMQEASTAEEAQQVQAQSQEQMIEAVRSTGMSVDQYNRISSLVQTDPEVRGRVETLLQ